MKKLKYFAENRLVYMAGETPDLASVEAQAIKDMESAESGIQEQIDKLGADPDKVAEGIIADAEEKIINIHDTIVAKYPWKNVDVSSDVLAQRAAMQNRVGEKKEALLATIAKDREAYILYEADLETANSVDIQVEGLLKLKAEIEEGISAEGFADEGIDDLFRVSGQTVRFGRFKNAEDKKTFDVLIKLYDEYFARVYPLSTGFAECQKKLGTITSDKIKTNYAELFVTVDENAKSSSKLAGKLSAGYSELVEAGKSGFASAAEKARLVAEEAKHESGRIQTRPEIAQGEKDNELAKYLTTQAEADTLTSISETVGNAPPTLVIPEVSEGDITVKEGNLLKPKPDQSFPNI
jgi:hypothetical protein